MKAWDSIWVLFILCWLSVRRGLLIDVLRHCFRWLSGWHFGQGLLFLCYIISGFLLVSFWPILANSDQSAFRMFILEWAIELLPLAPVLWYCAPSIQIAVAYVHPILLDKAGKIHAKIHQPLFVPPESYSRGVDRYFRVCCVMARPLATLLQSSIKDRNGLSFGNKSTKAHQQKSKVIDESCKIGRRVGIKIKHTQMNQLICRIDQDIG